MNLKNLLKGIKYETKIQYIENYKINNITTDSRLLSDGDVFVCIDGARFNSHDYAKTSLPSNVAAVVVQRDIGLKNQIIVVNSKKAYALMAANFFNNPAQKLNLIGVTGTNGKTSTTYIIKHILKSLGYKVGLIGTIQNEIEDLIFPAKYTTPDPLELNILFRQMVDSGCKYVVMEVSSHSIHQKRIYGLTFKSAVFTNLTQDHLDYHLTMENYYLAKKELFKISKKAILNIDDEYGLRLLSELTCDKIMYSIYNENSDLYAKNIKVSPGGTNFVFVYMNQEYRINIKMIGKFFVANTVAAVGVALSLGFDFQDIFNTLKEFKGVKGRAEILPRELEFTIIRDFAHCADGLEKILDAVNEFAIGRVVILFGCAGERDRTKRKAMAQVAAKNSDFIILTSDNPRSEDEISIINDAKEGLDNKVPYKIILDRYEAIRWALENSQKDDILILAGKGHEDYQVLKNYTVYFDEFEIISELLSYS